MKEVRNGRCGNLLDLGGNEETRDTNNDVRDAIVTVWRNGAGLALRTVIDILTDNDNRLTGASFLYRISTN